LTPKEPAERNVSPPARKPFFNKRVGTFLACVGIAAVFWVLHALSKEYPLTIRIPIAYSNLPEEGLVPVDMPDSVDAEVIGSGFAIFAYRFAHVIGSLNLDVRKARPLGDGDFALATYTEAERLESSIGNGLRILRVMPDTIVLSFSGRVEKKVPVRPRVKVQCAPSFSMGDSIRAEPAFVTISGAEALIKRIEFVETEQKIFTGCDHSLSEEVALVLPAEFQQVRIEPAEVTLFIPIGKYTEQRIMVPVEALNVPPNAVLKTIPDKVEVVFQVSVDMYADIRPEMFRVVVDYSKTNPESKTLPVEIIRQPLNVRNLHTDPARVEYVIRK
jgi:hypothetical protein